MAVRRAQRGDLALVKLLIEEGADPVLPINVGVAGNPDPDPGRRFGGGDGGAVRSVSTWFAAEVASQNGHLEVAEYLRQVVAEQSAEMAAEMGTRRSRTLLPVQYSTWLSILSL